jgi:hypothetical protein
LATVERAGRLAADFAAAGLVVGAIPSRSSSTAWRNDTPSQRITQSITDPLA